MTAVEKNSKLINEENELEKFAKFKIDIEDQGVGIS